MNNPCGLYIHIPFCEQKCLYCDFFSVSNKGYIDNYINEVVRKNEYFGNLYSQKKFDTIYIGGGTPSIIGTENLSKIINNAKSNFNIIAPEITIEMNPCSAQSIDFEKLVKCGVNRISLGVQSAHTNELKLLGRLHRNEDVMRSLEKIKSAGISNISLDLMIGISQQTEKSLLQSIDFCVESGAKHISAYILKIEENTPYKKLAPTLNLPNDDKQAEFYEIMQSYLKEKGYFQYEISNFSKDSYQSRHNLKYWNCDEYLGIGVSAYSFMDGKRFFYERDFNSFYNNIMKDDGIGGTPEEYIMLRLRLSQGILFEEYKNLFNQEISNNIINKAKKYSKYSLMNLNSTGMSLTSKGFLVSNSIISDLLYDY